MTELLAIQRAMCMRISRVCSCLCAGDVNNKADHDHLEMAWRLQVIALPCPLSTPIHARSAAPVCACEADVSSNDVHPPRHEQMAWPCAHGCTPLPRASTTSHARAIHLPLPHTQPTPCSSAGAPPQTAGSPRPPGGACTGWQSPPLAGPTPPTQTQQATRQAAAHPCCGAQ